jgi:hypothetical protein
MRDPSRNAFKAREPGLIGSLPYSMLQRNRRGGQNLKVARGVGRMRMKSGDDQAA